MDPRRSRLPLEGYQGGIGGSRRAASGKGQDAHCRAVEQKSDS